MIISKKTIQILAGSLFFINLLSACVSTRENPNIKTLKTESEYYNAVDYTTKSDKIYDGFNQTLDMSATLLNSEVSRAQLDQNARIYQWSEQDYANKKSELETSMSKQTQVFLSFFVPERKHDNLTKQNSVWKIFLDVNGKRVEGRVEKIKMIYAEIKLLYPHFSRFNSAYKITFPVPVSIVDGSESSFTMTGPVGSVKLQFPRAR
jgi:hypothetical protein